MKTVAAGILNCEGRLLICQRRAVDAFPLKWEFPGGKVDAGEQPAEALRRELGEELGIEATIGAEVERLTYRFPTGEVFELVFLELTGFTGTPENRAFATLRWVSPTELGDYDFLEADRRGGAGKTS